MTANDELLPCKVCRGKAQQVINYRAPCGARCMVCGFEAKNEETWNHRHQPYTHEQVMALVEALRKFERCYMSKRYPQADGDAVLEFRIHESVFDAAILNLTPFTQQKE